ncbi:MAG: hypothetical protein ACE5D0_08210 [Fidelibacterota bacterium]
MNSRKIKLMSFALILSIVAIGMVSGYNYSTDTKTDSTKKECSHKDAAKCEKHSAEKCDHKDGEKCKKHSSEKCSHSDSDSTKHSGVCCKKGDTKKCKHESEKKDEKAAEGSGNN